MPTPVLERVLTALDCAVVDPELRGVLLFDLRPEIVVPLSRRLANAMGAAPVVHLGSGAGEDAVWNRVTSDSRSRISVVPGPLVDRSRRRPPVVAVGDLARLGPAERRAAITLLNGEIAHLERNGLSVAWAPRSRWVAACARADVGRVSPHLLDRFPVRVDARGLTVESVNEAPAAKRISADIRLADIPGEVIEYVTGLIGEAAPGIRRELALARLARALATLDGRTVTAEDDVDAAISLIGLFKGSEGRAGGDPGLIEAGGAVTISSPIAEPDPDVREVVGADVPEPLIPGVLAMAEPFTPYPEDQVEVNQEPGSLGPGPTRKARSALDGGWPVGVRPSDRVDDIAVVATFLEAARHQVIRCPEHHRHRHATHIAATDLRSYRRAARPRKLLALVLDHTCRARWDWSRPLAPYLQWAYTGRAAVCVVEVGSRDAVREARAQKFVGAGLLDPRVLHALERPSGRCTPLAHGLELAASALRDRLHRGRLPLEDALLVVVTDGRGNVPLESSRLGELPDFARGEGFEDALRVARTIRSFGHLETVVIDPGRRHNARLTSLLSDVLGAQLVSDQAEEPE